MAVHDEAPVRARPQQQVGQRIDGARALGMHAILVDRDDHYPEVRERLADLYGLPAALGLARP